MSELMNLQELELHLTEAIKETTALLNEWKDSKEKTLTKKAQLLGYWIKTYIGMLRREKAFNPTSIPRLARRQVVSVDFGFRIGAELGGLHYAVVLDKENGYKGDTVTVIPLGSVKETTKESRHKKILKDGIFIPLEQKAAKQIEEARQLILSLTDDEELKQLPADERILEIDRRHVLATEIIGRANASIDKMRKLRSGSCANISQITTISKMRIKDPVTPNSVLYGVKVSIGDMRVIEDAVKDMFIEKGNL